MFAESYNLDTKQLSQIFLKNEVRLLTVKFHLNGRRVAKIIFEARFLLTNLHCLPPRSFLF